MIKWKFLLLILITLPSLVTTAQNNYSKISGQIVDSSNKPLESVTVLLVSFTDTIVRQKTLTNVGGKFLITNISPGNYKIRLIGTGFNEYNSELINISAQKEVTLPVITLQLNSQVLANVVVETSKSFIEEKIDRTVVNVKALISNAGANALEALAKIPGVDVDINGNLSLKGKSGVLVLINDKPTYLSPADLANYLRSLPASSLDKIELMDVPPAKYDAAGSAGVINIKMVKPNTKGFNGTFNANYSESIYVKDNEGVNLNYRFNKLNFFANAAYQSGRYYEQSGYDRNGYDASGNLNTAFFQSSYSNPVYYAFNYLTGIDYYLSKNTTCGLVFNGTSGVNEANYPVFSSFNDGHNVNDSTVNANTIRHSRSNREGANLNFTHKRGKSGELLTFDLDYLKYGSENDQSFLNNVHLPDGSLKGSQYTIDTLPSSIRIYAAKADYNRPMKNKATLETGIKSSFVMIDNPAYYYNVMNNISVIDYNNTNRFLYNENINAAYLSYNKDFSRFSIKSGVRIENTNVHGHQTGNLQKPDSIFLNHYTNIFPTLYFLYKLDSSGNQTITLAYGRRIFRPNYQDLNPFVTIVDRYTYNSGNPFLKPQFNHNFVLSYHYKSSFTAAFTYDYAKDIQIPVTQIEGNILLTEKENIGERSFFGFSVSVNQHLAAWWSITGFAQLNHNHYAGIVNNGILDEMSTWMSAKMINSFTFQKDWSGEISGNYTSRRAASQTVTFAVGQMNSAIQKKIWKNKGSIKLSANDIFHTYSFSGRVTNLPQSTVTFHDTNDSRSFTVGFTYSFGSKKNISANKRKTGAADTETERAGN